MAGQYGLAIANEGVAAYRHALYDNTIPIPGEPTYKQDYNRYAQHELGLDASHNPLRYWENFNWGDRRDMLKVYGSDVHPVKHSLYAYSTVSNLLREEGHERLQDLGFTPEDIVLSRITAIRHETGECTHKLLGGLVIGDIPRGKKQDKHRIREAATRWQINSYCYEDTPLQLLYAIEDVVAHRDHDTPAHRAFDGAHTLGFLRRGMDSTRLALRLRNSREQRNSYRTAQITAMAREVTSGSIAIIYDAGFDKFAMISREIEQNQDLIDAAAAKL